MEPLSVILVMFPQVLAGRNRPLLFISPNMSKFPVVAMEPRTLDLDRLLSFLSVPKMTGWSFVNTYVSYKTCLRGL